MKFEQCVFVVTTNAKPKHDRTSTTDGDVETRITLTAGDVPDDIVRDSAVSGQSPRVRFQSAWRRDGIPHEITMTWAEWFGRPERVNVPETPESIALRAQNDPAFRAQMLRALGLDNGAAQ